MFVKAESGWAYVRRYAEEPVMAWFLGGGIAPAPVTVHGFPQGDGPIVVNVRVMPGDVNLRQCLERIG